MQIKTTMRYCPTPVRINKSTKKTSAGQHVEKGELFCTVGENADWCSHCGKQYGDISKNKKWICLLPSNPTSGDISEGTQNTNLKEHKRLYVHCSIIYNHQDMEAAL